MAQKKRASVSGRQAGGSKQQTVAECDCDKRRANAFRNMSELGEVELLRRVLGSCSRGVDPALSLLTHIGSLDRLTSADRGALLDVAGIGPAALLRLEAALELGRRSTLTAEAPTRVLCENDVMRWARARLLHLQHEELWLLSLDARSGLLAADRVAQGGLLGCAVRPADALRPAVRNAAAAVVVVHNHPSGDPTPSEQDLEMTRQLAQACEVLGLALLDHVVVARGGCRSIASLGLPEAA